MIPAHIMDKMSPVKSNRMYPHVTQQWRRHQNRQSERFLGYAVNMFKPGDKLYRLGLYKSLNSARTVAIAAKLDSTIVKKLGGNEWLARMRDNDFRQAWFQTHIPEIISETKDTRNEDQVHMYDEIQDVVEVEAVEVEAVDAVKD